MAFLQINSHNSRDSFDITMAYAEDEPEEAPRNKLMFFGSNLAEIPCFRNSYMYGIGSGVVAGVVYNLATSRYSFISKVPVIHI